MSGNDNSPESDKDYTLAKETNSEGSVFNDPEVELLPEDEGNTDFDENFDEHLPSTVTLLRGSNGSKLYLIGTAHFSYESQDDVSKVIRAVRPHIVVLELCKSRASILQMDEETIKREAEDLGVEKIWVTIKEYGVLQGLMYCLLLDLSAQLTRDLGMAPGGEFRRALAEVKRMRCILHFGDRPIQVTLKRALNVLSWWQCIRFAYSLLFNKQKVKREDVEKCKQIDLLDSMIKEMSDDFPELGQVFVQERDIYLTYSLQMAASCEFVTAEGLVEPTVAVGVVGIGHTPGIKELWGKVADEDIPPIMEVKETSPHVKYLRRSIFYGCLVFSGWQLFKFIRNTSMVKTFFNIP